MKLLLVFLLVLSSIQSQSQYNKHFIDSIHQLVDEKHYNKVDKSGEKEGFWLDTKNYFQSERPDEIRTVAGFYFRGKKIGVWEEKRYGYSIRRREIYLDTAELRKFVLYYQDNGLLLEEEEWLFDPLLLDTAYTIYPDKAPTIKAITKGKYTRNGEHKLYWGNGQIKSYGKMENDKEKGAWLHYDEKGALIESKYFD